MDKKFFIQRFNLPQNAKWGIVEIIKDGESFYNPCLIADEGFCVDLATERFLVDTDYAKEKILSLDTSDEIKNDMLSIFQDHNEPQVRISPAIKRKTQEGFSLFSCDGLEELPCEEPFLDNFYFFKTCSGRLREYLEHFGNKLER